MRKTTISPGMAEQIGQNVNVAPLPYIGTEWTEAPEGSSAENNPPFLIWQGRSCRGKMLLFEVKYHFSIK